MFLSIDADVTSVGVQPQRANSHERCELVHSTSPERSLTIDGEIGEKWLAEKYATCDMMRVLSHVAYSIQSIKLVYYFPSVRVIVPLYKRLTINRAVGLVEILVYCRIG